MDPTDLVIQSFQIAEVAPSDQPQITNDAPQACSNLQNMSSLCSQAPNKLDIAARAFHGLQAGPKRHSNSTVDRTTSTAWIHCTFLKAQASRVLSSCLLKQKSADILLNLADILLEYAQYKKYAYCLSGQNKCTSSTTQVPLQADTEYHAQQQRAKRFQ